MVWSTCKVLVIVPTTWWGLRTSASIRVDIASTSDPVSSQHTVCKQKSCIIKTLCIESCLVLSIRKTWYMVKVSSMQLLLLLSKNALVPCKGSPGGGFRPRRPQGLSIPFVYASSPRGGSFAVHQSCHLSSHPQCLESRKEQRALNMGGPTLRKLTPQNPKIQEKKKRRKKKEKKKKYL